MKYRHDPHLMPKPTPKPPTLGNVWRMKLIRFLLTAIISFTITFTFAQSPYAGSSGDGYGRTEFIYLTGDPGPIVPSRIYPTAVGQEESFTVRIEGEPNKIEILVYSLAGVLLHRKVAWGIKGTLKQRIDIDGWAAGAYLVHVRLDGRTHRHKLVVMRKE